MRSLRHRSANELPCHGMAQVINFYSRLSPRQPRATLKTKINGGPRGPPFVEARVSSQDRIGFYEAPDASTLDPGASQTGFVDLFVRPVLPPHGPRCPRKPAKVI
jgi:hypothetical protein